MKHGRRDLNHREIIDGLRRWGVSVLDISNVGNGCPDIVCGFQGRNTLMEIKSADHGPRPSQVEWHRRWRGAEVVTVHNLDEALEAIGRKS